MMFRTNYHDPYTWNATTVGYILNRREYLGHTVLGKTTRDNFKTKRKRIANEDELLVFYNTHEAMAEYKAILEKGRQNNRKRSEKMRELRMSDPNVVNLSPKALIFQGYRALFFLKNF